MGKNLLDVPEAERLEPVRQTVFEQETLPCLLRPL
jgi:hypothetical protein